MFLLAPFPRLRDRFLKALLQVWGTGEVAPRLQVCISVCISVWGEGGGQVGTASSRRCCKCGARARWRHACRCVLACVLACGEGEQVGRWGPLPEGAAASVGHGRGGATPAGVY